MISSTVTNFIRSNAKGVSFMISSGSLGGPGHEDNETVLKTIDPKGNFGVNVLAYFISNLGILELQEFLRFFHLLAPLFSVGFLFSQ